MLKDDDLTTYEELSTTAAPHEIQVLVRTLVEEIRHLHRVAREADKCWKGATFAKRSYLVPMADMENLRDMLTLWRKM